MSMIEKLTPKQEKMMAIYRDKYIEKGLSTTRINRKEAFNDVNKIRVKILGKKEAAVVFTDSPASAWCLVCLYKEHGSYKALQEAAKAGKIKSVKKIDFVTPYIDGHWSAGYFAFYSYMKEVLKIKLVENFSLYSKTMDYDYFYPFDDVTFVSEKPTEIHREGNQLHNTNGAAIKYSDGFCLYKMHGITVPKEIAETPAAELKANLILKEKNADVRREIIRKIGIARIEVELGSKVIEEKTLNIDGKEHLYQLISLELGDSRKRPFLKMVNPSLGITHIEGVKPDCDTVEKALAYRNGLETWVAPIRLT